MPLLFLGAKDTPILHHGFGRSYIQATRHAKEELGFLRFHNLRSRRCWLLHLLLPGLLEFRPQCSFPVLGLPK